MRTLTRLLLLAVGLLAANCLVWGTFLAVCGGCALGGTMNQPPSPPATVVVEASAACAAPTPSPSRTPLPTRLPSPRPTYWIANPTASWPILPPGTPTFTASTPTAKPITPTPWPTQVIQGADAAAKAQSLLALAAQGSNIPFRVVFTESEIERETERYLAAHPDIPARNVRITLGPQEAVVSGQIQVSGLWFAATVHASVAAQDGKPVVTITRVDLGSIPLPPSVRDDLTRRLTEALAGAENLPFRFTAITLGDGRITIEGVTR